MRTDTTKETPKGVWKGVAKEASTNLAFEIQDDSLEVSLVEDVLALGSTQEEGSATDVVDLAGHALGVVVDAAEKAIAEELALILGDAEVVLDVASGLLQVEGFEVKTDGDALMEGLVGGKTEFVGQVGLTKKDEGDEGSRVHVVVEQEAELVEQLR